MRPAAQIQLLFDSRCGRDSRWNAGWSDGTDPMAGLPRRSVSGIRTKIQRGRSSVRELMLRVRESSLRPAIVPVYTLDSGAGYLTLGMVERQMADQTSVRERSFSSLPNRRPQLRLEHFLHTLHVRAAWRVSSSPSPLTSCAADTSDLILIHYAIHWHGQLVNRFAGEMCID